MTASKMKPRGKPFTVGDDPRRKRSLVAAQPGNPSSGPAGADEPLGDVLLYQDMRYVYTKPKSADRTQGHRTCRSWLDDDPRGFMGKLSDFEKAAAAREAEEAARGPDGLLSDPTSERVEELIGSMLGEASGFIELGPADWPLLLQRGLVGGDDHALTAEGRRALGLPART